MSAILGMTTGTDTSDAELVLASRRGDRGAFARIVERYQRLLCSLAYAATGDLSRSEDLAQEAFVVGWSELTGLREPERLRGWLCGILRNLLGHHHREARREPTHGAGPIAEALELAEAHDGGPSARLLEAEEQALLWRSIERIPTRYREPLVLFYRERRSVAEVAGALDLSEDAVRQRLTRGRRLLADEVQAFVEGALERTAPGKAFTFAVLGALPAAGTPARAAAASALIVKAASASGVLAYAAAVVTGLASGALGAAANLEVARSPAARSMVVRAVVSLLAGIAVALGALAALSAWAAAAPALAPAIAAGALVLVVAAAAAHAAWLWRLGASFRTLAVGPVERPPFRSRASFLGLPLVHVMWSNPPPGSPPAVGWIAVGDRAVGGLFAMGAFAVAPVAVGSFAVGIVSLGVVGVGALAIGSLALGGVALGAASVGFVAGGGVSAVGLVAASSGGLAVARDFAEGSPALARVTGHAAAGALRVGAWPPWAFPLLLAALGVVPLAVYLRRLRSPPSR